MDWLTGYMKSERGVVTLHTYEPGEHLEEHLEAFGFGEPDQPAKSALRLPSDGFRGVCGGREREQCEAVANGDGEKWRMVFLTSEEAPSEFFGVEGGLVAFA